MTPTEVLDILYAAVKSKQGVVVKTNDPVRLHGRLNHARKSDPEHFKCLKITASRTSPENELWIFKKDAGSSETHPQLEEG